MWWNRYQAVIWLILGIVFVGAFLYKSGDDLRRALPIVRDSSPAWVLAAVSCQMVVVVVIADRYRIIFSLIGPVISRIKLAGAYLRRHALSSTVPLGGPVGLVRFVRDLEAHRVSPATTLYGSFLAAVVNQVGFLLFITPVLGWMIFSGQASTPMLAGAGTMIIVLTLSVVLIMLGRRPGPLQQRLFDILPGRVAKGLASVQEHAITPRELVRTLPHSLGINLLGTAALMFSLWSVGVHPDLAIILTTRVAASLVIILLPIWQGAGALELTVLGMLVSGGVAAPDALAAIAVFRIAQFWFPLLLGAVAFFPEVRFTSVTRSRVVVALGSAASAVMAIFAIR